MCHFDILLADLFAIDDDLSEKVVNGQDLHLIHASFMHMRDIVYRLLRNNESIITVPKLRMLRFYDYHNNKKVSLQQEVKGFAS